MMGKIKSLIIRYKGLILYVVFGAGTTLINWLVYYLCYAVLGVPNVPSTVIAWILSVAFAFITNKLWVFGSRSFERKTLLREAASFTAARLATGVLDVGIMVLAVDVLSRNAGVWKLLSNIIVVILNYVISKLVVFKKK